MHDIDARVLEECAGEVWKPVVGWEGIYDVSNRGRVRRVLCRHGTPANKVLKPQPDIRGYRKVQLQHQPRKLMTKVSRLVCAAFHGPPPNTKSQVNHKNGIKTDDGSENLEWVSCKENIQHAIYVSMRLATTAKITPDIAKKIAADARSGKSTTEMLREYRIHRTTIDSVRRGVTWSRFTGIGPHNRHEFVGGHSKYRAAALAAYPPTPQTEVKG